MRKAIAIDFDGCLCTDAAPEIGDPNWAVINRAKVERQAGAGLILWTCREGQMLQDALDACESWGLTFDAVNESLPDWIEAYGNNPRKVGASEYWDDKAVRMGDNPPLTLDELREMDGEPIYITGVGWKICYGLDESTTRPGIIIGRTAKVGLHGYGTSWTAYSRKPEEPTRTKHVCAATGGPCCWCNPGPCGSRKPTQADENPKRL